MLIWLKNRRRNKLRNELIRFGISPIILDAYEKAISEWDELLARYQGQAVIYHGHERLAVASDGTKLFDEYLARGYKDAELMLFQIEPEPPSPWTIDYCERLYPA